MTILGFEAKSDVPGQSLSTEPLSDGEYDDGELIPVDFTSTLGRAILHDRWLNFDEAAQAHWVRELRSPQIKFIGTVLSRPRKQVELHLIYKNAAGGTSHERVFCISFQKFNLFL